jgi:hypothetical protein
MLSNPHRLAWITMLGGLMIFFLLCVGTVVFTRWLVFESPTQLSVTLHVGRGTVGLAEPNVADEKAVRANAAVGEQDTISTDSDAQGYLAFTDPYSDQTIATVTLHNDSMITLSNANRPRFNLSDNAYTIRLEDMRGHVDVWVRPNLDRDIQVRIESLLGTVRIAHSGQYMLASTANEFQATVREGTATLVSATSQTQHCAARTTARIAGDDLAISVGPAPVDLLGNSTFAQAGESDWPVEWVCNFTESPQYPNAPSGNWDFTSVGGHSVIHIQRMQPEPGPGTTGCQQMFGTNGNGLDVTAYDSLTLRVTMRIHHQQLSACGVDGSECPVMLYIKFGDQNGNEREWYHGLYADYTPGLGMTICDSCLVAHDRINKDTWYTYEKDLTNLPVDWRPAMIETIEFSAKGHQVEVIIDEVSLLASPVTEPITESATEAQVRPAS